MKLEQLLEDAKLVLDRKLEPWKEAEEKRVYYFNQLVTEITKRVSNREWEFRQGVLLWHEDWIDPEKRIDGKKWIGKSKVYLTPSGLQAEISGFLDGERLEYQRDRLRAVAAPNRKIIEHDIKPEILKSLIDYAESQLRKYA